MIVTRLRREFGVWCATAVLAAALLVATAPSASAQVYVNGEYTLTFDDATVCAPSSLTSNCQISGSYGTVAGVNTSVNGQVTTGFSGTAGITSPDLRDFTGSVVGETAGNGNIGYIDHTGTGSVGVFSFFAAGAHKFFWIDSLRLGLSNSAGTSNTVTERVRVYQGSTVLYTNDFLITGGTNVLLQPLAGLGGNLAKLGSTDFSSTPLRLEFGYLSGGIIPLDQYFTINNITFDVGGNVAPEPGSLSLLGFGLVGLAPMIGRRRRRRTA